MDNNEVSENIQYFLGTVMKEAAYKCEWSRTDLTKAYDWAKYCEDVYLKAENKGCLSEMDHFLAVLGRKEPFPQMYQHAFFKNSCQELYITLRNNPNVSEESVNLICKFFEDKWSELPDHEKAKKQSVLLFNFLKDDKNPDEIEVTSNRMDIYEDLFLEYWEAMPQDGEKVLKSNIKSLMSTQFGLTLIFFILRKLSTLAKPSYATLEAQIKSLVLKMMSRDDKSEFWKHLLKMPKSAWVTVFVVWEEFRRLFLQMLEKQGISAVNTGNKENVWAVDAEKAIITDFDELCQIVEAPCGNLGVRREIIEWLTTRKHEVWRDVLYSLKARYP